MQKTTIPNRFRVNDQFAVSVVLGNQSRHDKAEEVLRQILLLLEPLGGTNGNILLVKSQLRLAVTYCLDGRFSYTEAPGRVLVERWKRYRFDEEM